MAKLCRSSSTVLPPTWENCATAAALHCYSDGITVRRKQENFATEVGKLCHREGLGTA
ncbi:MAG: hypothetical protein IJ901_00180 [Bacteroidaceae bacterium]|nr:hypothetical protein [Bacteroidaceae bacterium]